MDPEIQRQGSDDGLSIPLLRDRNGGYEYESIYDRPLPWCGCGVGWCSFLAGFLFPPFWYYGTYLFFSGHGRRDLRDRPGLGACAIAALISTVAAVITVIVLSAEYTGYNSV